MATEVTYHPDHAGDWGTASTDGSYTTEFLAVRDGTKLFYRRWHASDPQAPVLVLLHGLGAHSGWFIDMGSALCARGVTVYANDHRGFGRSEGPRGHVTRYQTYLDDLEALLAEIARREPGRGTSLLGHSMGGLFALYLAAADSRHPAPRLAGIILLNPWIRDQTKVTPLAAASVFIGGMLGSARMFSAADNSKAMTVNAEAARMLADDPYWVRAESVALLYQVALRMRSRALAQARQVRAPALVLQAGRDQVVVATATRRCFEALGSVDKTYTTYPAYAHDAEFERDRTALDDDIAHWLLAHAAPRSGAPGANQG